MSNLWNKIQENPFSEEVPELLKDIKQATFSSTKPTNIKFGTSGWRGIIGDVFTLQNLKIAVQAIVEMMKTFTYLQETKLYDFQQVKTKGILIGRDTRFLGQDFSQAAAEVLAANGIKAYITDRPATTPDLSLTVVKGGFAGSINITPSHNPFEYSGIKFNPADGGTADPLLTNIIEEKAKEIMTNNQIATFSKEHSTLINSYSSLPVYVNTLFESKVVDLDFIKSNFDNDLITFIVDNVHGASYGYIEEILKPINILSLRNTPDVLFAGTKPEPSPINLKPLFKEMEKHHTPLKLGVILDPDGDRVRFMDGIEDLDMNYFGAIAFHYLVTNRKITGGIAKSVATSNLVNIIAKDLGLPIFETAVGFKNFRKHLKEGLVACAFEESDGITLKNHTLEKDGLIGTLLALEITLRTKKPLSAYLKMLQDKYGYFYPERFSTPIDESKKEELATKLNSYKIGDKIGSLNIKEIITVDGFKFIFEDQSWLMIRPSGTEPKVRIYVESRKKEDSQTLFQLAKSFIS